jgi:hypothetical protein
MFKIIAFFIKTQFPGLYVRVGILLTCWKQLHDGIISLRREVWANKTRLISPTFYWSVGTQPGMWAVMYLCVRGIDFVSVSSIILLYFRTGSTVVFFGFHVIDVNLLVYNVSIWVGVLHWWCIGYRARIEYGRSLVRAWIRSKQRL